MLTTGHSLWFKGDAFALAVALIVLFIYYLCGPAEYATVKYYVALTNYS